MGREGGGEGSEVLLDDFREQRISKGLPIYSDRLVATQLKLKTN